MQDYIPIQKDINEKLPTVTVKQFDNLSRFIHVQIFDNDLPNLPDDEKYFNLENCTARLYIQPKGDDSGEDVAYIDGEVADGEIGIVTFLLPSSVTETAGNYEGEIWIYGAESSHPIISTKSFDFVVEKSIRNNTAIEGTSKFTALDNVLSSNDLMRAQMAALIASPAGSGGGDVGTELRDIRVGYDDTMYTSAGEAVRGQVNGLKSTLNNILVPITYTENTGYYFNVDGSLEADSSTYACVYTDKITVYGGQTVKWSLGAYTYKHYLWGAYMEYDSENEIIGSRTVFCNTSPEETETASGEFTVSENASKIAFCWRSYGQSNMLTGIIFYDNNFISNMNENRQHISNVRGQVNGLKSTLNNILVPITYTENAGYYFSENGSLKADSNAYACVYTDKIDVYGGQTVKWSLGAYTYKHYLWGAYMEYDSENEIIGSRTVFCNTSPEETETASGEFTVSENASKIALCWRSYGQSNMLTGVIFYDNNFISDMNENRQHISNVENMLIYSNGIGAATELKKSHYVRYSDGVAIGSGGYLRYYTYVNPVFKHIKAFVYASDTVAAAIAFYSGTEINSETYMQKYSVPFKSNSTSGNWHEADVPDGCDLVVITTRTDYTNAPPLVEFSGNDTIKILDSAIIENKGHIAEVDEKINAANGGVLFGIGKYFYHFGMAAVAYHDVPVNIPSQSIFDVRNAANLGYKCIECNIQKTLDNKYVVTHGLNGYLGHDFNDLNGNNVGGQIKISDVTFDDLRTLYVYRCTNPDYRTPITSLEEFLYECKKQGVSVMAGYKDEDSLYIARGIMGANLIMYNAPRSLYDGVILEWRSDATKAAILARCETVGKPYIYSMAEPSSRFTDEELVDIVKALHNAGYYVASAYVGNGMRFLGLGFDFIAVDTDPNPDTVINGKKLIFNQDGTVTWTAATLS